MNPKNLNTTNVNTWCPGCTNFCILESVKKTIVKVVEDSKGELKQEDFAMTTGIGCHAKIFDYLNISGIYGLHGRVIPTCLGMKLGNPNLKVLGFAGDGDTYAEGSSHFVHAGRHNADMTLIVHNNQAFSLTTGQSTPTSQRGYKNKAEPLGEFSFPLNPIRIALASGASFVARCNAKDIAHTSQIIERAIKHKGFAFVEVIQPCLIFNLEMNELDDLFYKLDNKKRSFDEAMELANKWDYNSANKKIPIGIFYERERDSLEKKWPQLRELGHKKIRWKDFWGVKKI